MARRESGNFQVVVHQSVGLRERMVFATEKLLLIVVAGAPSKDCADVQLLALDLAHHIIRLHAFGRVLVMRAAGRMHVMITGIPMVFRWVDPALHGKETSLAPAAVTSTCLVCGWYSGPIEAVTV